MQGNNYQSGYSSPKRGQTIVALVAIAVALVALSYMLTLAADTFVPQRKEIFAREAPLRSRIWTLAQAGFVIVLLVSASGWMLAHVRRVWREAELIQPKDAMYPALRDGKGRVTILSNDAAQIAAAGMGKMSPDILKLYLKHAQTIAQEETHARPLMPEKIPIYQAPQPNAVALPVGQSVDGKALYLPLDSQSPVLVAGSPGGGKSEFIAASTAAIGLNWPDGKTVQVALCDPKALDFAKLPPVPFMPWPVAHKDADCIELIRTISEELKRRQELLADHGAANIGAFRREGGELPYIALFIDEVSRLTNNRSRTVADEANGLIQLLGEQGRAFGIVPILATQRPARDTVGGQIVGLCDARICFRVATDIESRIVLGMNGAEALEGRGNMLYRYSAMVQGKAYYAGIESGEFRQFLSSLPAQAAPRITVLDQAPARKQLTAGAPQPGHTVFMSEESPRFPVPQDRKPAPRSGESRFVYQTWRATAKDSKDGKPSLSAAVRRLYGVKGGQKFHWTRETVLDELRLRGINPQEFGFSVADDSAGHSA